MTTTYQPVYQWPSLTRRRSGSSVPPPEPLGSGILGPRGGTTNVRPSSSGRRSIDTSLISIYQPQWPDFRPLSPKLGRQMKLSTKILAATVVALAITSGAEAATLMGADTITITNAIGTYLQVAEVVATQAGTGTDVSLATNGATASAPDQYASNSGPVNAIDGNTGGNYYSDGIYHSAGYPGSLTVSLAAPANLSSLTLYGRTDCCSYRDVYNVVIDNAAGGQIYSGTLDATGASNSATVSFGAVPEPASWALMLVGVGGLGVIMRRSRRSAALPA